MRFLKEHKWWKRISSISIFSFISLIIFKTKVKAGFLSDILGDLVVVILKLFVGLADGAMTILQKAIFGLGNYIFIAGGTTFLEKLWAFIKTAFLISNFLFVTSVTISVQLYTAVFDWFTDGDTSVPAVRYVYEEIVKDVDVLFPETIAIPMSKISPYEIFSNQVPTFDVDFFNPSESIVLKEDDPSTEEDEKEEVKSTAEELKSVVATWYKYLRDIAIVMLLSILVYIGIRIIISSASQDKAKYKQMLVDWLVAICLIFIMQYIMSFSNIMVKKVIQIFSYQTIENGTKVEDRPMVTVISGSTTSGKKQIMDIYKRLCCDENGELRSDEESQKIAQYFVIGDDNNLTPTPIDGTKDFESIGDDVKLYWPANNFLEAARLKLQFIDTDNDDRADESYEAMGYSIIYVDLVLITFIFVYQYLKRVIYMAFLTMIAPLVAMTYPIDKLNDGQAQAFNMWFKEYIFNLLIQPMHLLLYTVLIGSAMAFASQNIIYVLVALGFMVPAEKLLRKMFGFEKAQTPGVLGGAAGAALAMTGMQKLLNRKNDEKGSASGKSGKGNSDEDEGGNKIRTVGFDELGDGAGAGAGPGDGAEEGAGSGSGPGDRAGAGAGPGDRAGAESEAGLGARTGTGTSKRTNDAKERRKLKNRIKRGATAAGRSLHYYGRGLKNKFKQRAIQGVKKLPGKAIKTAGGLALGGTAAIAGGLLGIASGDPSNILKYGGTGLAAGYVAGKSAISGVGDSLKVEGVKDVAKQSYYTKEELEQKEIEKQQKQIKQDLKLRYKLEDELGDKDKAEKLIDMCSEYGMDDAKEMLAVNKVMEKHQEARNSPKIAIKAVQLAKSTNSLEMNDDESAKLDQKLKRNYTNVGYSDEKAIRAATNMRKMMDTACKKVHK